MTSPRSLTPAEGRRVWLRAQRLDVRAPFGDGPAATARAVEHLGYVQIDTIFVIERSHHHILFTRIPAYRRSDLHQAQTVDRTVFEYWTHALAYMPTRDLRFALTEMKAWKTPTWYGSVTRKDLAKVLDLITSGGPVSIRDIDDDVLVEKNHPWASRKPSKRALQLAFFKGLVTIRERLGMLKSYELFDRHFGFDPRPKADTETELVAYMLDRALASQGIVSLSSVCHLDAPRKPAVLRLVEARVRRGDLVPVVLTGKENAPLWMRADVEVPQMADALTHLLSPFDPLVIQRKRAQLFFDYEHRFEAYVPKDRRVFGYFALPVLVDDRIVAAIDLKTDRERGKLLVQKWTWLPKSRSPAAKRAIEEELGRFEAFQLER